MNSLGREIHAANGKAQACTQDALLFFPFKFLGWGWGEGEGFFFIFPWFPMCSQCVLTMFPSTSQWVSSGSQYVPQVPNMFPNISSMAPHFYPICFGKCCPPFTYVWWAKGEELYASK
jgi:hypothetical protein